MPSVARRALVVAALVLTAGGCGADRPGRTVVRVNDPTADNAAEAVADNVAAVDLIDRGKLAEAAAKLERATTIDPRLGPAQNNLGTVQMRLGHPVAAAIALTRAADLMPRAAAPRDNLGLLYESVGRFDDAIRWYDAAVALAPDDPEYVGNAARARVRRGDQTEELRQMLSRVADDPRPAWSQWARDLLAKWPRPTTGPE